MKTVVFHSYPTWLLSGVNTWSVNLAQAMKDDPEFEHIMLITGVPPSSISELDLVNVPYTHLKVPSGRQRRDEWRALKDFLECHAPCIYLPNYDFHRASAAGTLSADVRICSVMHSDEDCYYGQLQRIGYCCDAIITPSKGSDEKVRSRFPELQSRTTYIPYGSPTNGGVRKNSSASTPLRLFYCNRISQYQKRVFDLPEVCRELGRLRVDFHLTVAGVGPDEEELKARFKNAELGQRVHVVGRLSEGDMRQTFLESDIFLLTSDFEGLPISLLEAMAAGCVPVVYDIDSGVRDAIDHGVNGLLSPHGNVVAMAHAIAALQKDRSRLKMMSTECIRIHGERFSLEIMAHTYRCLFRTLTTDSGRTSIRDGRIRIPKDLSVSARILRRLAAICSGSSLMRN